MKAAKPKDVVDVARSLEQTSGLFSHMQAFTSSTWHAPAIFFSLQFFRSSFTYPSLPSPVDFPALQIHGNITFCLLTFRSHIQIRRIVPSSIERVHRGFDAESLPLLDVLLLSGVRSSCQLVASHSREKK
jgi:hypothetical protein